MKKAMLVAGLFLCCLFLLANEKAEPSGILKIGFMTDITTQYPWGEISLETNSVLGNVYESLVKLSKTGTAIEPCLAESLTPSADYKTWTAHLRKNVKFHDGSLLTADAVVESLSMHHIFANKVKKIDDYTIIFNLDKPNVSFPITLSTEYYSITSLATIKCYQNKCKPPIFHGTGPFMFKHWNPGKEVELLANEHYWGQKPLIKEVWFIPFQNDKDLVQALKNQTIHLSIAVAPNSIELIREMPNITFRSIPTLGIGFLSLNTSKTPFADAKIRYAIGHAINTNELVKKYFYQGKTGAAAKTFLPSLLLELPDKSLQLDYDPAKAKALLKQAGYPDGFETTLLPTAVRRPYMPDPLGIAEDIKKYLAVIGIKVQIVQAKSWQDFLNNMHNGTFDMMLYGWFADNTDPCDMLSALLTTESINAFNSSRWSNKKFDSLVELARSQKDIAERTKIYQEAQIIFHQDLPFVPLFSPLQTIAWNEKVKGFTPHPINRLYLQYLSLSP